MVLKVKCHKGGVILQRKGVVSQRKGSGLKRKEWFHKRKGVVSKETVQLSLYHKAHLHKLKMGGGLGGSCRGSDLRMELFLYHLQTRGKHD